MRCLTLLALLFLALPADAAPVQTRQAFSHHIAAPARNKLRQFQNAGKRIDVFLITRNSRWLIVAENHRYYSDRDFFDRLKGSSNTSLRGKIEDYLARKRRIDAVALTSDMEYVVVSGDWRYYSSASKFDRMGFRPVLERLLKQKTRISSISFGTNDQWVIVAGGRAYSSGIPGDLKRVLDAARLQEKRRLKGAWFRPAKDRWIVLADHAYWATPALDGQVAPAFRRFRVNGWSPDLVALDAGSAFSLVSNGPLVVRPDDLLGRLELSVPSGGSTQTFWQLMETHKVPGLAVAVIHDDKVVAVRGYGKRRRNFGRVRYDTIFPVASLSKAVASFGMLKAAQQNDLSIRRTPAQTAQDYPRSRIRTWIGAVERVGSFGARFETMTVQDLLSHTAGTNVWGIGLFSPKSLPTKKDLLLGTGSAGQPVIPIIAAPRTQWMYSGGGYTVAEVMLETETGKGFGQLMRENVLDPLGMRRSTFGNLSRAQKEDLAYGHVGGNPLPYRLCPGKAAGGLFSTAGDYARFVQCLMNLGRHPTIMNRAVLPTSWAQRQLTRATTTGGAQIATEQGDRYGLGVFLSTSNGSDGQPARIWHGGTQRGYRTYFTASIRRKSAIVLFANGLLEWKTWKIGEMPQVWGAGTMISDIQSAFRAQNW